MSAWFYLLQQSASAWSLLLSLGLHMGLRKASLLRLTATALACGSICLLCAMQGDPLLRTAALMSITILAPMAAWPNIPRARRRAMCLCSLLLALLMTGCTRLLHSLGLRHAPLVMAQFALLPLLIHLVPDMARSSCITLRITHACQCLSLTALVDTGNLLHDPLTHLPVIVISRQAASKLLPNTGELLPGMRLISVRTVAGTALMPIFRPQQLQLLLPQGWQSVHAVVGLSPDGYSGFQALVPASVTSSPQGGISVCP